MKKNTIKYEYKCLLPFHWKGKEYSKNSTQKELAAFYDECKLARFFVDKKGGEK